MPKAAGVGAKTSPAVVLYGVVKQRAFRAPRSNTFSADQVQLPAVSDQPPAVANSLCLPQ